MATEKKVKIKVLNPLARKYRLSASVGSEISIEESLGAEIVENKDAVFVNKADEKLLKKDSE